ncbi:MAG: hypothetical protein HS115_14255 [Spirochaetales bacterium]|nr:hypothetical protein [Spirochaetales bacterium]
MPVEKSFVDSMLGVYRNMLAELKAKGSSGPVFEKAVSAMVRMEQLALELDDVMEFSTRLSTENLHLDFSNAYGRALGEIMAKSSGNTDEAMMAQTLKAYEDALEKLKKEPSHAHIVPVVQKVVDLGRQGLSYPVFLRTCEEQGVFLGLESPHARPSLRYEIECAEIMGLKLEKERAEKILAAFEAMVARSAFGYPDPVEYEIVRQKIEWEFEPRINRWNAIVSRWDRMIEMLQDWTDSFTSFAPTDSRWAGENILQTRENIAFTQECNPGFFKVREKIFTSYFGFDFEGVFEHETFLHQREARLITYSDELIDLCRKVYPHCRPGQKPPADLIQKAEELHHTGRWRRADYRSLSIPSFPEWLARTT